MNYKRSKFKACLRLSFLALLVLNACAGTKTGTENTQVLQESTSLPRPKLVVGIVVDQMRYDFLFRYWNQYGNGGFKKLVSQGFNFKYAQYSYVPTYTGPGHASIYTGSVPAINGIVGNNWYDRSTGKTVYCVEDATVKTVGSTSDAGLMSPRNLWTTTITDELRLATNMESKVIGVALKDRGSIIPAGHLGNGAYWFDSPSGNWITSTYYTSELPEWVQQFNSQKYPDQYLSQVWNTLLPIEQYTQSTADNVPWEGTLPGEKAPVFPHDIPALRKNDFELLRLIPAGNTITKDFAMAAIAGEQLGKGNQTDFLTVSFSTPDYAGHTFGPNSIEVQDVYLRLDREIEELLQYLDQQLGKENVLVFLTADHGAAHVPGFLIDKKVPAGVAVGAILRDSTEAFLNKTYGSGKWVERYLNQQLYLNHKLIESKKLNKLEVQDKVADYVTRFNAVSRAMSAESIQRSGWNEGLTNRLASGYNAERSGDVLIVLRPGWFEGGSGRHTGTTHGSYSNYDTHVPLVWYGWRVKPGESAAEVEVSDIAPTIASWLYIQEPDGTVGKPLQELMKK